jgi:hypothetical protein
MAVLYMVNLLVSNWLVIVRAMVLTAAAATTTTISA